MVALALFVNFLSLLLMSMCSLSVLGMVGHECSFALSVLVIYACVIGAHFIPVRYLFPSA